MHSGSTCPYTPPPPPPPQEFLNFLLALSPLYSSMTRISIHSSADPDLVCCTIYGIVVVALFLYYACLLASCALWSPSSPPPPFFQSALTLAPVERQTHRSQCTMSSSKIYSQFHASIQSCWYFQPSVVTCTLLCCPSPLLSSSTLPPPPFPV